MTTLTPTLTPADLQAFIAAHNVAAILIPDMGHTPTVPAAAEALGVEPDQIIKTLLFLIDTGEAAPQPVIVIGHGVEPIDKAALARHFGVSRKKVKLADAPTVLTLLGYPAGGVPPFGHRTALPTLIAPSVLALRQRYAGLVYGGGGDDRTMLRLTVDELLRVTGADVL